MRFDRAVNMRRWRAKSRRLTVMELAHQLAIDLQPRAPVWLDPDDIPDEGDYPTHTVVSAAGLEIPKTKAACSVFDFAASIAARQVISEFMLGADEPASRSTETSRPAHCRKIVRDGDITRHIALREQDTPEWAEKEQARRSRQKPPRPTKQKFKMKGTRQWADAQS